VVLLGCGVPRPAGQDGQCDGVADEVLLAAEADVDVGVGVAALSDAEVEVEVPVPLAVAVELDGVEPDGVEPDGVELGLGGVELGLDELAHVVGGALELDWGIVVGPVVCVGEVAGGLGFGGRLDNGGRTLVTSLITGSGLFGWITPWSR
jgi:hypothetical protein